MTKFYTTKNDKVKVDVHTASTYLDEIGYRKISIPDHQETLVRVENNIVSIVTRDEIYTSLMIEATKVKVKTKQQRIELIEQLSKMSFRLKNSLGPLLNELEGEFIKDTPIEAYMYYKNTYFKITANSIERCEYSESTKLVWNHDIIQRNAPESIPDKLEDCGSIFYYFIDMLVPVSSKNGLLSIISSYGYMLHKYKDPTYIKAWILYDENIDMKDPDGRTGKTLLVESLRHFLNTITEDGKHLKPKDKFAFSRLTEKTRILILDDVAQKYIFEYYFSLITSDFTFEKKNKDRSAIPFWRSPKLILTSNYDIKGSGGSHKDRRIENVISNFFSADNTPKEQFEEFFTKWSEEEWSSFDCFGILALQHYLKNGIIEQDPSKEYYLLIRTTSEEFIEFAEELVLNTVYFKKVVYKKFYDENPEHFKIAQNGFTRWIKMYADYKGYKVRENHSDDNTKFEFYKQADRNPESIESGDGDTESDIVDEGDDLDETQ